MATKRFHLMQGRQVIPRLDNKVKGDKRKGKAGLSVGGRENGGEVWSEEAVLEHRESGGGAQYLTPASMLLLLGKFSLQTLDLRV